MNETLRLFPPILTIPKRCASDAVLTVHSLSPEGEATPTQIFVPAGANVRLDVFSLHHSPMYWGEDTTSFDPSRFVDTEGRKWNRDAFVPFSAGQRACIGKSFAMVEATGVSFLSFCSSFQGTKPPRALADFGPPSHSPVVLSKILLQYEVHFSAQTSFYFFSLLNFVTDVGPLSTAQIKIPGALMEGWATREGESQDARVRRIYKASSPENFLCDGLLTIRGLITFQ